MGYLRTRIHNAADIVPELAGGLQCTGREIIGTRQDRIACEPIVVLGRIRNGVRPVLQFRPQLGSFAFTGHESGERQDAVSRGIEIAGHRQLVTFLEALSPADVAH